MILLAVISNITSQLDKIIKDEHKSISSHAKTKEKGLTCLLVLIDKAPPSEYNQLLLLKEEENPISYLANVMCILAEKDSSNDVRSLALDVIYSLTGKLDSLHDDLDSGRCSRAVLSLILPGVASTLFRLIIKDTKLPKNLLINAAKTLSRFITVALLNCHNQLADEYLNDTCDNLAVRLDIMFSYIINHNVELHIEVLASIIDICEDIVCHGPKKLLSSSLKTIVKYTAFISSRIEKFNCEQQLKLMIIVDTIRDKIENSDSGSEKLETVVITYLFQLIDNLEEHSLSMLSSERQSELSMLYGFLKLLPSECLETLFEIEEKRAKFISILIKLTEFSTQQPFLFLTDTPVDDKALESINEKIYTLEKRFSHLNETEIDLVKKCCLVIGQNLNWLLLIDLFKSDLKQFTNPSNLYITHLILRGCLEKSDHKNRTSRRFIAQTITFYLDKIHDEYVSLDSTYIQNILKIVIALETMVTLVELHVKCCETNSERVIILKTLLCPLLNWASSNSRAISEAGLCSLAKLAKLYHCDSTKGLIESNIDYIVDGITHLLENFIHNPEVINVLAITFKLSSLDSFYYFKDVYERVFRLLGTYYHTAKSKQIALLFYRTLVIINDWKTATIPNELKQKDEVPLKSVASCDGIIKELSIRRRVEKLRKDMEEAAQLRDQMEKMEVRERDQEDEIMEDLKSGKIPQHDEQPPMDEDIPEEQKKAKTSEIILTEKIIKHCVNLISSNHSETKILALKAAAQGLQILRDDEDTLLPLVHQLWSPLLHRLTSDYQRQNLEINLCAFECLVNMAECAKDFIKRRTLGSVIPRLCLFLESLANQSKGKSDYGPYCMTMDYKCQLRILTHLGALAYHIQLAYSSLWRIVKVALLYLDAKQAPSLRQAALISLHYIIALDADCVWYFAKRSDHLNDLPFELIYEAVK